jgi:hypothetical protein
VREALRELVALPGVRAVALLSPLGALVESHGDTSALSTAGASPWKALTAALNGDAAVEAVFARGRLYLRAREGGYLVVVSESHVPAALLRLQADLALDEGRRKSARRGLLGFFGPR